MARTQAPTIDAPLTASAPRVQARAQTAVDQPLQASRVQAGAFRQQTIIQDVPSVSQPTVRAPQRISQPLKYIQQPTQAIITSSTTDVVVPGQTVAVVPISSTTVGTDVAVQQQAVVNIGNVTTTTATTNRVINTSGGNGVTTVNNQRINQQYQVNNPGGNTAGEIQFLNNGKFAADKDFKYWSDSDTLQLNGWLKTANLQVGNVANLGQASNLVILGGNNGEVLRTDGNGNVSWTSISVASSSNAINDGTSTVSIETNSNVNFTVGGNSNVMTVTDTGALANVFTSNNYVLGNATTTISNTKWLDAVTFTVNPTVLFTCANTVSSVDVHITADDGTSKQITKMLSVTKDTTTTYSQYGNVLIGTDMASFYMDQSSGLVRVIASPATANRVDYRLVVTLYS